MNDSERMPDIRTSDKRMLAWLNEGSVLIALAKNDNQPTYIAKIARLAPEITRSSKLREKFPENAAKAKKKKKEGGGTKPGMKAAAERLCKRGILLRTEELPPNKKTATPHYSINPSIDVLATILRTFGSWVGGEMMNAGFAGALIEGEMDRHLRKVLQASVEDVRRLPKAEKEELAFLARSSRKAMEVFLDPQFELKPTTALEKGEYDLLAQLKRLKGAMLFALVAEVASSSGLKIWEKGWDVEVDIDTVVNGTNAVTFVRTRTSPATRMSPSATPSPPRRGCPGARP